jgi:cysteine synthase
MAQGVAWRARELGVPCTVVAPDTAPAVKLEAVQRLGGRVIQVPFARWWQTFQERAYPGVDAAFLHAFDDPDVMAGNGTIGLEILEDLPEVDAVVIPWGGGGLTCGVAAAVRAKRPGCRLYAAEVSTAAPLTASLAVGCPAVVDHQPSFVDGIGSKTVFPQMLARAGAARRLTRRGPGGGRGRRAAAGRAQPRHRRRGRRLPSGVRRGRQGGWGQGRVRGVGGKHRPEDAVPGLESSPFLS